MPKKLPKSHAFFQTYFINELILFAMYCITTGREICTFERITKECFTLFPESFAFFGYPKWPDARKLDRPLRTLRKKKLIKGNPKTFFTVTKQGKIKAQEIAKTLRQKRLL